MTPDSIPKIVLVGCGVWGKNIARNLASLDVLAGVDDHNAEAARAFGDEFNAPIMPFADAIANEEIDGIAIVTPPASHAELAAQALKANKAVYIEKPMALTMADAKKISEAAGIHGQVVMVGHLIRHHSAFQTLLEMVKGGAIGRIRHIRADRLAPGRIRSTESVMFDLCPHDLALIAGLTDQEMPKKITCHGFSTITPKIEDSISSQLDFASGITASLNANWLNPIKIHTLTVIGEDGALIFDDQQDWPNKLTRFAFKVSKNSLDEKICLDCDDGTPIALTPSEPLKAEMMNFIAAISKKALPLTDLSEALYVQRIMTQMHDQLSLK